MLLLLEKSRLRYCVLHNARAPVSSGGSVLHGNIDVDPFSDTFFDANVAGYSSVSVLVS